MAIDAFFPKITLPKGKTDIRKGEGLGIKYTGENGKVIVMVVDAFEGGEPTRGLIDWLKSIDVKQIDLAVATHAHGDHFGGFYDVAEAGIKIKDFRCYHIDSIREGNSESRKDSDNLLKLIRWLQARGTRVLFVDHGDILEFGDISWHIYRKQPKGPAAKDDPNAWSYVNDGSLVLCSPELSGIIFGDGPAAQKEAIAYFQKKFGRTKFLIWVTVSHHGGHFSMSNAQSARNAGCEFAYESCVERRGPGKEEWTEFGARRLIQNGVTVWMQDENIYIHAAAGKITFKQGNKTLTYDIPYQGKESKVTGKWEYGTKGWWYKYSNGGYATGWKQIVYKGEPCWFLFDDDGWMLTGWRKDDGKWYFLDYKTGVMLKGWHKLPHGPNNVEDWYLLNKSGEMLSGWQWSTKDGKTGWYYLDPDNGMRTGWIYDDGSWFHLGADGKMVTGWVTYKGRKCYLEPKSDKNHVQGTCYVNRTAVIDGKTYKFDKDGYATEEKGGGKSSLNGVDIASYQSSINPAKLTTTDFVIVKFTQGTTYLNPYAGRQYSVAKAAGKLLGAYHYGTGKSATAEAQYFVNHLGNRIKECVLALDWEGNQNSVFGTGKDVAWCKEFLDEVYRLTGIRPLIYMSKSVCRKYNWSSVAAEYPLWCAQYKSNSTTDYQSNPWTDNNGFGAWDKDTIRQYSSHGRIAGYDSNIDIDLAYMSAEEWRAMAGGKVLTKENPIDVAISIAESYLGYHEGANNKTIFGDTMHAIQPHNMDANAAWCDAFVDFVILKTCEHFGKGAETARMVLGGDFDDYTYNSVALYKKAGRWSNTAHRGDQIFFGGSGHTGIVTSVESGTVHTIEGNKADEVRRGSYSTSSPSIIGYGRPRYDLITGKITAADMPLVKKSSKGEAVRKLQEMLNAKGYKLTEDGDFGSKTEAAVKAYQKANGLEVDGEVGEKTWASLMK